MDISAQATTFLILFARVGGVLMLLPVFSEESVPMRIRLLIALGFAAGMWGMLGATVAPFAREGPALAMVVISEMIIGVALGMVTRMMFQAAAMAGSIISLQIGLTSVLVPDPGQGGQAVILSRVLAIVAAIVCMGMGVHHLWIASIVQSYHVFPIGGLPLAEDFARLAVSTSGRALGLALSLSAPLIVYAILFNAGLGLTARMAPAIQVFFIAQPLNVIFGLGLLAVTIGAILSTFAEAMANFMHTAWG
jgi:flagellar biosynthesis protein FliR